MKQFFRHSVRKRIKHRALAVRQRALPKRGKRFSGASNFQLAHVTSLAMHLLHRRSHHLLLHPRKEVVNLFSYKSFRSHRFRCANTSVAGCFCANIIKIKANDPFHARTFGVDRSRHPHIHRHKTVRSIDPLLQRTRHHGTSHQQLFAASASNHQIGSGKLLLQLVDFHRFATHTNCSFSRTLERAINHRNVFHSTLFEVPESKHSHFAGAHHKRSSSVQRPQLSFGKLNRSRGNRHRTTTDSRLIPHALSNFESAAKQPARHLAHRTSAFGGRKRAPYLADDLSFAKHD